MTIKPGTDPSWQDYGHDRFLSRSLQPQDANYMTSEDFSQSIEAASLRSSAVGGNLLVKRLLVKEADGNRLNRVLIGKFNA